MRAATEDGKPEASTVADNGTDRGEAPPCLSNGRPKDMFRRGSMRLCYIGIVVMKDMQLRFTTRTMLAAVFFICYILAAFVRGSHLLGAGAGLMYAFVAILVSILFIRCVLRNRRCRGCRSGCF